MYDYKMILRMALDKKVWKELMYIHNLYKIDSRYNILKGLKVAMFILKNEKIVKHEGEYVISTFIPPFCSKAFRTVQTAVVDNNKVFQNLVLHKRVAPISTYLEITKSCNMRCKHCSSYYGSSSKEVDKEKWIKVIQELQDMGVGDIGITGGEPLLKDYVVDLVRAIDSRSKSMLFTNGTYFSKDIALQLKEAGLFSVGISLDSCIEEVHNENRCSSNAFSEAVNAIKNAKEAKIYTMIQTVVLRKDVNFDYLKKFFDFCKSLNVDEIKILEPIRSGRFLTEDDNEIFFDEESRDKLINIQHIFNRNDYPKITTFAYTESKEKYGCGAGVQHTYINAEGNLMPCDFVPMSFGNVFDNDIKQLWSKMYKHINGPKIGCFANMVNNEISRYDEYPLNITRSCEICKKYEKKEYTDYEKVL